MRILAILTAAILIVSSIFWFVHRNNMQLRNFGRGYVEVKSININPPDRLRSPYQYEFAQVKPDWENIDASSAIVINPVTNQTFYSKNSDEQRPIASITKLMTALVVLDLYNTTDVIKMTKPVDIKDRRVGITIGDSVTVQELLEAMLISSKNDVAHILASEYKGGYDEFVNLMNQKAEYLGMKSTNFSSPSGYFDDGNYSTASDLAILARAAISKNEILEIVSKSKESFEFTSNGIRRSEPLVTTNELIGRFSNAVGLKTGQTLKSGPSYIGYFKSSETDQIIVILLNAPNRFEQAIKALRIVQQDYSFTGLD